MPWIISSKQLCDHFAIACTSIHNLACQLSCCARCSPALHGWHPFPQIRPFPWMLPWKACRWRVCSTFIGGGDAGGRQTLLLPARATSVERSYLSERMGHREDYTQLSKIVC